MHNTDSALFTDQYELTMLQAYLAEGMTGMAVFDLFVRELPEQRNFLLACGLDDVLRYLEGLAFTPGDLRYLESLGAFTKDFLDALTRFRFTGTVRAVPEGTPVFSGEPIVEVIAPMPEAQLVETYLLNQITFGTMIASKGARVVRAAAGRPVIDFGARRTHGADAAMKAARALYITGFASTSLVRAGQRYGIAATGTMAHSYIEAHESEPNAFAAFAARYPETTLLVDTYDTEEGVRNVVRLAKELGDDFRVRAVRLDSGDLERLAFAARRILDGAGLQRVGIVASGGLDEYAIDRLVRSGAPIDVYAVGTNVGVSADAPKLDSAYKLVEYAGRGRMKLSAKKATLPGQKQVVRRYENGVAAGDVIALRDEAVGGKPLLVEVMRDGRRLPEGRVPLTETRERTKQEIARLPERLLSLERAEPPYPVEISPGLREATERLQQRLRYENA